MLGLLEVFYSPAQVFDRVRERGTWLPALLAIIVCAVLASYVVVQGIGMETLVRKQIESNPRQAEQLGPEGIARAANSPFAKGMAYGAPLIATPLILVMIAGLFLGGTFADRFEAAVPASAGRYLLCLVSLFPLDTSDDCSDRADQSESRRPECP